MNVTQPGPDPNPPTVSASMDSVDLVAAEYLERLEAGASPSIEAFAARLSDPERQASFRKLVAAAAALQGVLPSQLRPGILFAGRYRIVREIGAGGMGKVFEVEDQRLGRHVALKVMAAMPGGSLDAVDLFERESRLLATLQHPNIVAVHEAGREGDIDYFVMDLVRGTPLTEVIERVRGSAPAPADGEAHAPADGSALLAAIGQPVPEGSAPISEPGSWWRSVARVMAEVARTLEAAHAHGVVHRDIKPGNVLLRGDGTPVILDFGLAATRDSGAGMVTRGLFGSVAYLAPEQAASGQVGAEPTTDVYQMGLVLYELLTLHRAVRDDSITQMLDRIAHGRIDPPRSLDGRIPEDLAAICQMATELDPARRYQSAAALREDLQRYLDGTVAPLASRGAGLRTLRYAARRHRLKLLGSGAVAAGLVIGALLLSRTERLEGAILEPIRLDTRSGETRSAVLGETVRQETLIGVRVQTGTPTWIYALSVYGEGESPAWVTAMRPAENEGLDSDGKLLMREPAGKPGTVGGDGVASPWALDIAPGTSEVFCSRVQPESPDGGTEGLWVFACSQPEPALERWLDSIDLATVRSEDGRVSLSRAVELFDQPLASVARGGQPRLSEVEQRTVAERMTSDAVAGLSAWTLTDPRRFQVFFRVKQD